MSNEKPAVGIDLGTTFSVVASLDRDGKPITIPNDEGDLSTPSVVYFDSDCVVVGEEAINAAEYTPERAVRFVKRDMGNDYLSKKIGSHSFPPEVVLALVLQKLKADAELRIGEFDKAVITVPAYFNEPRRKATQDAGRMAGIEVLDIINEPTAAAIAFGVNCGFVGADGSATSDERVLVYDLGGGTFDVTLMEMKGTQFDAVATAGDVHLGGMDWDGRLMSHLAEQFQKEHGIDPRSDESSQMKLLKLASRAKKTLTARDSAQVRFALEGKKSTLSVSRTEFESLTEDLVERTRLTVRRMLKDSVTEWSDITRLLLVGGSTRMPMIQRMLEAESGLKCDRSLSPDEAVAHGAAVYASTKLERGAPPVKISNVNSHDLGVLGRDPSTKKMIRQLMIGRNSKLPQTIKRKFVTSKDGQREVVVAVVEGGTNSGAGATRIGKCRVTDLPADLPKGTPIHVTFKYSTDGRLVVDAEVPSAGVKAHTTIQRSSGMTEETLKFWTTKIAEGLKVDTDTYPLPATPAPKAPAATQRPKPKPQPALKKPQVGQPAIPPVVGGVGVVPEINAGPPVGNVAATAANASSTPVPTSMIPKSPAVVQPVPDVPMFEESAAAVAESRIILGGDDAQPGSPSVSAIPDFATEEKSVGKVEESRIFVNNDEQPKKQVDDSDLGDFLKNL